MSYLLYMKRSFTRSPRRHAVLFAVLTCAFLLPLLISETGGGVMEYFGRRKIEAAKEMIRRDDGNFTEIANRLGYQSIYYFSRHFKKVTGMTPSEYASGVRALAAKTKPGGG